MFSLVLFINESVIIIIIIFILIEVIVKSPQIGLYIWLPIAIEGLTPVSTLIYTATMVTAEVYLLMCSSLLLEFSSTVLLLYLWLNVITTIFSSFIRLF